MLAELELVRRLRSAEVANDPLQVLDDASGESHGVDVPELEAECGRMVLEAAAAILKDDVCKGEGKKVKAGGEVRPLYVR